MMCWKEEWAYAIRDINKAIKHVKRAQEKLEKRRDRAKKHYRKLSKDKKHGTAKELAAVQAIIDKNTSGIARCLLIVNNLRYQQQNLRTLIEELGINSTSSGSEKVRKILEETFAP